MAKGSFLLLHMFRLSHTPDNVSKKKIKKKTFFGSAHCFQFPVNVHANLCPIVIFKMFQWKNYICVDQMLNNGEK